MLCSDRWRKARQGVTALQAVQRGRVGREVSAKRRSAAITLQSSARGHLQRGLYSDARRGAISIESAWRMHLRRRDFGKAKGGAVRIQSLVRRGLARSRMVLCVSKVVALQRWTRVLLSEAEVERRRSAVRTIQLAARWWLFHRWTAAVEIQSFFRRLSCHRHFSRMSSAVLVIQSWLRCAKLRRSFLRFLSCVRTVQLQARWWLLFRSTAAVEIQAAWRRWLCLRRQRVAAETLEHEYASRIIIYSVKRWYCVRASAASKVSLSVCRWFRVRQLRVQLSRKVFASVRIQAWTRRFLVTSLMSDRHHAAKTIQLGVRWWLFLRSTAAVDIQSVARRWLTLRRSHQFFLSSRLNEEKAVVIQAWFRRSIHLREFEELRRECCVLQGWIRRWLFRRFVVATKIQTVARRRIHLRLLSRVRKVVVLQAFARRILAGQERNRRIAALSTIQLAVRWWLFLRSTSAVEIQASVRRWICLRRSSRGTLGETTPGGTAAAQELPGHLSAVSCIQRTTRRWLFLRRMAAVKIQSMARRRRERARSTYLVFKVVVLQRWIRRRCSFADSTSRDNAACTIQLAARWWLFVRLTAAVEIQAAIRRYLCSRRAGRRLSAVSVLQCAFRRWHGLRWMAATLIQTFFRQLVAVRHFEEDEEFPRVMFVSKAVLVQTRVRRINASQELERRRLVLTVRITKVVKLQSWIRRVSASREVDRRRSAVRKIQIMAQSWVSVRIEAVVEIQSATRRWSCVRQFQLLRQVSKVMIVQRWIRQHRALQERNRRNAAVCQIQMAARWWLFVRHTAASQIQAVARRWICNIGPKQPQRILSMGHLSSEALTLQTWTRRSFAVQESNRRRSAVDKIQTAARWWLFLRHTAAAEIQAVVRGWLCSRRFPTIASARENSASRPGPRPFESAPFGKAAIIIQRWWRGFMSCVRVMSELVSNWRIGCSGSAVSRNRIESTRLLVDSLRSVLRSHVEDRCAISMQEDGATVEWRKVFEALTSTGATPKGFVVSVKAFVQIFDWVKTRQPWNLERLILKATLHRVGTNQEEALTQMAATFIQKMWRGRMSMIAVASGLVQTWRVGFTKGGVLKSRIRAATQLLRALDAALYSSLSVEGIVSFLSEENQIRLEWKSVARYKSIRPATTRKMRGLQVVASTRVLVGMRRMDEAALRRLILIAVLRRIKRNQEEALLQIAATCIQNTVRAFIG